MEPEKTEEPPAAREREELIVGKASLKPHAGGLLFAAGLVWYGLTFLPSAWALLSGGVSPSLGLEIAPQSYGFELGAESESGILGQLGGIPREIDGWIRRTPVGSAIAAALLVGMGLKMAWRPIWRRLSYRVILTRSTIGAKAGIIARDRVDLPLAKIESVELYQTAWGRVLGYGDLLVSGSGSTRLRARGIDKPLQIAREAQRLIAEQDRNRYGSGE